MRTDFPQSPPEKFTKQCKVTINRAGKAGGQIAVGMDGLKAVLSSRKSDNSPAPDTQTTSEAGNADAKLGVERSVTVRVSPEIEGPSREGKIAPVQGQRVKKRPNSPGLTRLCLSRKTGALHEKIGGRRALLWPSPSASSAPDSLHKVGD